MPLIIHPRVRKGLCRLAAMTAIGVLGPAGVAAASCPTQPTTTAFAQFGDQGQYFPAPGGTFEGQTTNWTVTGNGALTPGNEPFYVNSSSDSQSLMIGGGATVTSPTFCVDETMVYFRFVSKQLGNSKPLNVALVLSSGTDATGSTVDPVVTLNGVSSWTPSGQLALASLLNIPSGGSVQAQLRFQVPQASGGWQVDDVLVDPYRVA